MAKQPYGRCQLATVELAAEDAAGFHCLVCHAPYPFSCHSVAAAAAAAADAAAPVGGADAASWVAEVTFATYGLYSSADLAGHT